jgi:hypothetical protein
MNGTAIHRSADEADAIFEVTVQLNSWALGDAHIVMTMPVNGELHDLLDAAFPEQRSLVCSTLRARIGKELKDAFEALKAPAVEVVRVSEAG